MTGDHCPTYREIGAGCGISSTSMVSAAVYALRRAGWIRLGPDRARSIELSDPLVDRPTSELLSMRKRIDLILAGRTK